MCKFCTYHFFVKFALLKYIANMSLNDRSVSVK